jgi:hypothetical protein
MTKVKNEKNKAAAVKGKKLEVKVEKPKRVRRVRVAGKVEPEKNVPVNVPKRLPVFEKHQVLKVLESGHTKTHFHCAMDGGFTQHVPKSKFN